MSKHTIIDNDDYTVELEDYEGELFLHADIRNISKSIYRNLIRDWLDMEEALYEQGFTRVFAIPLDKKGFITRTGWELYGIVEQDGKELEVYIWELSPLSSEQ